MSESAPTAPPELIAEPTLRRVGIPGMWQLLWPDGIAVLLKTTAAENRWSCSRAFCEEAPVGEERIYQPALPLPEVETLTMRELRSVLTQWRRRELGARQDAL